MPLPDGVFQDTMFREIVSTIATHFKEQPNTEQPNTVVSGSTIIYYEEDNPHRSVSPDCYVAYASDVKLLLNQEEEQAARIAVETRAARERVRADALEAELRRLRAEQA
jgi:hypothetical protein